MSAGRPAAPLRRTGYDRDRKLRGVFAAARDITGRKQLDLALLGEERRARELQVRGGEVQPREVEHLPGINGIQALQILRADPSTAGIPVIAISANAMPLDISRGINAGFFRYLTKPIRVDELMSAIDEALVLAGSPGSRP